MKLCKKGCCVPSQACLVLGLGLVAGLLLVGLTWWVVNRLSED